MSQELNHWGTALVPQQLRVAMERQYKTRGETGTACETPKPNHAHMGGDSSPQANHREGLTLRGTSCPQIVSDLSHTTATYRRGESRRQCHFQISLQTDKGWHQRHQVFNIFEHWPVLEEKADGDEAKALAQLRRRLQRNFRQ